jgi:hypothetical protein
MCYGVYDMLRRVLGFGSLVALAIACASPTLPLPPPETPVQTAGSDKDHIHLAGAGEEPFSNVIVVNLNPMVPNAQAISGSRVDQFGAWGCDVYAHAGDELEITEDVGEQHSPPTQYLVH